MANKLRSDRYGNEAQKLQFLSSIFTVDSTKTILELGSGSGKLTQLLEKTGAKVYAVDRREPTLPVQRYVQANFLEEEIPVSDVDFAFLLFPYLGVDWWNLEEFFVRVAATLKIGGQFALDLGYYNTVPFGYTEEFDTPREDHVLTSFLIRKSNSFVGHMTKTYPDGTTRTHDMMWRLFEKEELTAIGKKSGLTLQTTYLNFTSEKTVEQWAKLPEKTRLCVVFTKTH